MDRPGHLSGTPVLPGKPTETACKELGCSRGSEGSAPNARACTWGNRALRAPFTGEMPSRMGFSSSPNPWGFAGCGSSTVCKDVCLQSNLAQEQGSREAVGSLSLGILAACLYKALSCCSPFKAETHSAGSRHWTGDSQGTYVMSVSLPAPGTSMLSAKPPL